VCLSIQEVLAIGRQVHVPVYDPELGGRGCVKSVVLLDFPHLMF
jgi:hypothetical protein